MLMVKGSVFIGILLNVYVVTIRVSLNEEVEIIVTLIIIHLAYLSIEQILKVLLGLTGKSKSTYNNFRNGNRRRNSLPLPTTRQ